MTMFALLPHILIGFFAMAVSPSDVLSRGNRCALPFCADCVPAELIVAPGYGFDISTSYATSAVRYHDGTLKSLIKVEASSEFISMMQRLSTSPPVDHSVWEITRRRANRILGWPSTPDVGLLSELLTQIREETAAQLDIPSIDSAVVVSPNFKGLEEVDVQDALLHSGLNSLLPVFPSWVFETPAAFAGNGRGLCRNYVDCVACSTEEDSFPQELVLAVHYTGTSISVTLTPLDKSFVQREEQNLIDWSLGLDSIPSSAEGERAYWAKVVDKIRDLPNNIATGWAKRPVTSLLLLGDESALDERFQKAVRDALGGIRTSRTADEIISSAQTGDGGDPDPVFAATKGAAEFAKRLQESPRGCREPERCKEKRRQLAVPCEGGERMEGVDGQGRSTCDATRPLRGNSPLPNEAWDEPPRQ